MRLIYASAAVGLIALAIAGSTKPSSATIVYPWCAHYGGWMLGGAPNCGFTTVAQCKAAVSGTQGTCQMNPWYEFPPQPQQRARVAR